MRKKWYRGGRKERRKEKRRSETVPDARDASLGSYLEKAYERLREKVYDFLESD